MRVVGDCVAAVLARCDIERIVLVNFHPHVSQVRLALRVFVEPRRSSPLHGRAVKRGLPPDGYTDLEEDPECIGVVPPVVVGADDGAQLCLVFDI